MSLEDENKLIELAKIYGEKANAVRAAIEAHCMEFNGYDKLVPLIEERNEARDNLLRKSLEITNA